MGSRGALRKRVYTEIRYEHALHGCSSQRVSCIPIHDEELSVEDLPARRTPPDELTWTMRAAKQSALSVIVLPALLSACSANTTANWSPQPLATGNLAPGNLAPGNSGMSSNEVPVLSRESQARLLRLLRESESSNKGHGGAIFRIESMDRGLLWEGSAGRLSKQGAEITPQHAFEIASITKTFTAAAVLLLHEEGKIDLDAPMSQYLGSTLMSGLSLIDGNDYSERITARLALSHRSGLADFWSDGPRYMKHENEFVRDFEADPTRVWQPERLLTYVRRMTPVALPGEKYHYSDTNYVLLGLMLERITGMSLASVFRERILMPLGMHQTYLSYREPAPLHVVESHRYESHHDLFARAHQSADWASGGLVSTTSDLTKFVAALEGGRLFRNPQTLDEMRSWNATDTSGVDYGLGLFRVRLPRDEGFIEGHDGHGNSWLYYWPRRRLAFAGTLNQTENDWWPLVKKAITIIEREWPE